MELEKVENQTAAAPDDECERCLQIGGYCGGACNGAHNWYLPPQRVEVAEK